ncbi:MAG: asparagine synthase (glutamine-hydrolyzing) [Acidobacteria bacterium]|nr:asparagine synthase (glutamine-hydrolyzing) [Acidobacteriota bacterium]
MCGIAAMCGPGASLPLVERMIAAQGHRGPDAQAARLIAPGVVLGHDRLSILDLSDAGRQPMSSASGQTAVVFNGEIYNYLELRTELDEYPFRTGTDTEVLLAAYERWGDACLDRLLGMFAFAIWDARRRRLFLARDRFGVKPLHLHTGADGSLIVASEIKALHAAGVPEDPDPAAWASYLAYGTLDGTSRTFWKDVRALPGGWAGEWTDGTLRTWRWYDLPQRIGTEFDARSESEVREEYEALLEESVRLRFRADVPVGVALSGGLDSSVLIGAIHRVQPVESDVAAFTFVTGDERYDELPWVKAMLARTRHPLVVCRLTPEQVPDLAASVDRAQDGPSGGLPTLAYARLFEEARARGVIVLLDGQGMDEQWAGYDYYARALDSAPPALIQGSADAPLRPDALTPEFRALAEPSAADTPFPDALRNAQYRDLSRSKLPRALRFNDRVSMRASTELREPFLDHRLVELAMRQPTDRKRRGAVGKWMLREIAATLVPDGVVQAPKRPVQTPQREWLKGPLRPWATDRIEQALDSVGGQWLSAPVVRREWAAYLAGASDNSFYVWQWITLGGLDRAARRSTATA